MSDQVAQAESTMLRMLSRWALLAIAGAMGWAVVLLINIDKRDSVQSQRIDHISETLDDVAIDMEMRLEGVYKRIDEKTTERYTTSDARVDKARQAATDTIQNTALERILQKIQELEGRLRPRDGAN